MPEAPDASHLRRRILFVLAIAMVALTASVANAGSNLLLNGDFAKGSGPQPDEWRIEAWIQSPEAFATSWEHAEGGGSGELVVDNLKPNDGRWQQSLTLEPGWYYVSAEVRTENVGDKEDGATISILDDGIMSPDIRGTSDWQKVGIYLKLDKGADVEVALRVGGFGSLNSGRAHFRSASVTKIEAPAAGATPVFNLTDIRKESAPTPIGKPYTLVLVFIALGAGAIWGWRLFGEASPPVPLAQDQVQERKRATRQ